MNPAAQLTQQLFLGKAVRENHALEHATITLLSHKYPDIRLAGVSIAKGFFIFGDVPTDIILPIAEEALERLRKNEPELAIHERCGTNLAVAGLVTAGAATFVARLRKPFGTFNNAVLATTAALFFSRPLGMLMQKFVTTHTPHPAMKLVSVKRFMWLGGPAHFVQTDNPEVSGFFS